MQQATTGKKTYWLLGFGLLMAMYVLVTFAAACVALANADAVGTMFSRTAASVSWLEGLRHLVFPTY